MYGTHTSVPRVVTNLVFNDFSKRDENSFGMYVVVVVGIQRKCKQTFVIFHTIF